MYYAVLREREKMLKEVSAWPKDGSSETSDIVNQIFGEPGTMCEILSVEMREGKWLVWICKSGLPFDATWFDYYSEGKETKFPSLNHALDDMVRTISGNPMPDMTRAQYLIDRFCEKYYNKPGDYADLSRVALCYTTLQQDSITPVEVYANLVDFCIDRVLSGYLAERRHYNTLAQLVDAELFELDIDREVVFTDEQIADIGRNAVLLRISADKGDEMRRFVTIHEAQEAMKQEYDAEKDEYESHTIDDDYAICGDSAGFIGWLIFEMPAYNDVKGQLIVALDRAEMGLTQYSFDLTDTDCCGNFICEAKRLLRRAVVKESNAAAANKLGNNDVAEFVGQLIDGVEDFLEKRGIRLDTAEGAKVNASTMMRGEDTVIITGPDYAELSAYFRDTLRKWELLSDNCGETEQEETS